MIDIYYLVILFIGSLTHAIRNFAKGLESSLRSAISGIPEAMINVKVRVVH